MMLMTVFVEMVMGMGMFMIVGMLMMMFMGMGVSLMRVLMGMCVVVFMAVSANVVVMNVHRSSLLFLFIKYQSGHRFHSSPGTVFCRLPDESSLHRSFPRSIRKCKNQTAGLFPEGRW